MSRGPNKNSFRQRILQKFKGMAAGDSFPVAWEQSNTTRVCATQYCKERNVRFSIRKAGSTLRCIRLKGRYWQ